MKRKVVLACSIFIFFIGVLSLHAYTSPGNYSGYVNDFAGILSTDDKATLEEKLVALEANTTDEVAVVTINTTGTDETIETYATKLFEEWGIGKKDKDNGILFLIALQDRTMRIEVGYGLEGTLPDAYTQFIQQKYVIPEFKEGNYSQGIVKGTDAIIEILNGNIDSLNSQTNTTIQDSGNIYSVETPPKIIATIKSFGKIGIVLSIIAAVAVLIFVRSSKMWWLGSPLGALFGAFCGFLINQWIFVLIIGFVGAFIGLLITSKIKGGGSGFGGFPSGGISTGGVFSSSGSSTSFGGGRSGGGGSSSSW